MADKPKTDLEEFAAWADKRGHYVVKQLILNYRNYQESRKEKALEAQLQKAKQT